MSEPFRPYFTQQQRPSFTSYGRIGFLRTPHESNLHPHKCAFCNKSFQSLAGLKIHTGHKHKKKEKQKRIAVDNSTQTNYEFTSDVSTQTCESMFYYAQSIPDPSMISTSVQIEVLHPQIARPLNVENYEKLPAGLKKFWASKYEHNTYGDVEYGHQWTEMFPTSSPCSFMNMQ